MKGEPGYFGSYGFEGWAGVGEAKLIPIMHELMHSYWGGFPIIGRPELSWDRNEGEEKRRALAQYHEDILAFMAQPPDEYELLRQRFRNLPGLSSENTGPMFHSLEADLPYMTGGDLSLVPPILRKFWGYFLEPGPFHTWERAAGWYQSLSHDRLKIANGFIGFSHLDLRQYENDAVYEEHNEALAAAARRLPEEERRRFTDLVEQFDLLLGDAQLEENFQFWRGYLQDKAALHRAHPDYLDSLGSRRATEIARALEFLNGLEGTPEERASALKQRIPVQPFLVNFLPAVDNGTLVKLFAASPELPVGSTLQATASFVYRLRRFGALAEEVLAEGRESSDRGAIALRKFVAETGVEKKQDLRLFFDLFHDADPPAANRIAAAVDQETIQALMPTIPAQLRTLLQPEILLGKLDVTLGSKQEDLERGIVLLIDEPSGNYRIDEPFLEELFKVMAARAKTTPGEVVQVMAKTPFPLEGMILGQPAASVAAMSADLGLAADLIENSDEVVAPPARIIYRLIAADPSLAATLVLELDRRERQDLVTESLAYFAYDKARSEKYAQLSVSLGKDAAFLTSLLERQGEEWLETRLAEAVELYHGRAAAGEVATNFLVNYRDTLEAAAETLDPEKTGRLPGVIRKVFKSGQPHSPRG